MQEQIFKFRKERPTWFDMIMLPIVFISFMFLLVRLGSLEVIWSVIFFVTLIILIATHLNRKAFIKVSDDGLEYRLRKNTLKSSWQDIKFIELPSYPSGATLLHSAGSFRIITTHGSTDWLSPFYVVTNSSRKNDKNDTVGDNQRLLLSIIKEKSGITPGLGATYYSSRFH